LKELTDGELWIFRGMAFRICGTVLLNVRRPILKVLLITGYLVSVGSRQADRYLVKYEDIRVIIHLRRFYRWL